MDGFDPYRKWLGIPPQEQPPNHYRLLGIGLFETDFDVISNASDRQMFHVRTFQSGPYAEVAQFILNELAAARVCLLDPPRKAEYDRWLQQMLAVQQPSPQPMMAMPPGVVPQYAAPGAPAADWSWSARTAPATAPMPPPAPAPWASPAPAAATAGIAAPRPIVAPPPRPANPAGSDFFAAVTPTTHLGHVGHHKKKDSVQAMTVGIVLTVVCFAVVLIFLAAYAFQSEPATSGADPMFGPGAQTIIQVRPAPPRTSTDTTSPRVVEHAVEHPVQQAASTPQPQPQPVAQVEESYDDIPVVPSVDHSAPIVPARNPQPAAPPNAAPPNAAPPNAAPPNAAPPNAAPPNAAPPAGGNANPEPPGLDPDQKRDSLDKAVR